MKIVYICTVLIFILSFVSNTIYSWKHPYFNIGKEESGKNGVLIRNLLFIGTITVFVLVAINVGRYVNTNGFLYITVGYMLGSILGKVFSHHVLNRKYKDVVYEKYSVKKAREAREAEEAEALALAEAEALAAAEYEAEFCDSTEETEFCDGDEALLKEDRGPRPPDHSKEHPWD